MKYHWVGFTQSDNDIQIELDIPYQYKAFKLETSSDDALIQNQNSDENFKPQIIQTTQSSTLVSHMTKTQVKESCLQFLRRAITDSGVLELAVGDCVISNYRGPLIEIKSEEGVVQSTQSRQAQIRRNSIMASCQQQINLENNGNNHASEVEKQLLLGVCVSGKAR